MVKLMLLFPVLLVLWSRVHVVQGTLGEQTVQGWVVPKGEIEGDSESSVLVQMGANLEQSAMHHVDN